MENKGLLWTPRAVRRPKAGPDPKTKELLETTHFLRALQQTVVFCLTEHRGCVQRQWQSPNSKTWDQGSPATWPLTILMAPAADRARAHCKTKAQCCPPFRGTNDE